MKLPLAGLLALALILPSASAVTFGSVASTSDAMVDQWYDLKFNQATIGFVDYNADTVRDATEPVYLHLKISGTSTTVLATDVRLDSAGARPPAGDLGKTLSFVAATAPAGATKALDALLIFKDLAPAWSAGGPDGKFGVGDGLYIDFDQNGDVSPGDLRLAPVAGMAAFTLVTASNADLLETTWAKATESICIGGKIVPAVSVACPAGARAVSLAYIDNGATATVYDANEIAYLSTDAVVGTGDVRVTANGALAAGTVVICTATPDADCGTTLVQESAATVSSASNDYSAYLAARAAGANALKDIILASDTGNSNFGVEDGISFSFDASYIPKAGDVRIVPTAGNSAGTMVVDGISESLTKLSAAGGLVVMYHDSNTDNQISAGEGVLIKPTGSVPAAGDVRLVANGACPAGNIRSITDTCDTSLWKVHGTFTKFVSHGGNSAGIDASDDVYLAASTTLAVGDLKIRGTGAPKILIPADTAEVGAVGIDLGALHYADLDGTGTWTYGDAAYLDTDSNGLATPLDFRIYSPGKAALSWVGVNDGDAARIANVLTGAGIKIVDLDNNGPSNGDLVIFHQSAATQTGFGNARLTASPWGFSAGTRIAGTNSDSGQALAATAYSVKYVDNDSTGTPSAGDWFYGSLTGNAVVSATDIRLTAAGGQAAGTFVFNSHSDQGAPLTTLTQTFAWLDIDGDRSNGINDLFLLEHDGVVTGLGVRLVGPGDVWLTGTGGAAGPATSPSPTPSPAPSPAPGATPPPGPAPTPTPGPATPPGPAPTPPAGRTPSEVAAFNYALRQSLTVTHGDAGNSLGWTDAGDELGYEVHSANSPFKFVVELPADSTSYLDAGASKDTKYIVTAFFADGAGGAIGKAAGIDADGLPDVPGKESLAPAKAKSEAVPMPAIGLLVIGLALVAMRRRK